MKSLIPLLCAVCVSLDFAQAKPNLVFIIADDLTLRDIGCYGGQAHTPNIDFLATEGMLFERCFQSSSMCSPTRHNIYTGLYPFNSEAYPNHTFAKLGTKSVVQYLKPLGYRVALSGKGLVLCGLTESFNDLRDGRLIAPLGPRRTGQLTYGYRLVWPAGRTLTMPVRRFHDWVRAECEALIREASEILQVRLS